MSGTSEYIYKESQSEFLKIKSCCNTCQDYYKIKLSSVNKINELEINCNIVINKVKKNKKNDYYIGIWIDSKKIWIKNDFHNLYSQREKLQKYSSDKINDFLLKFKNNILPNLKLDKVFGKFDLVKSDGSKTITKENIGIDIFGLEYSNCDECSVCYESTYTLTHCSHPLCIGCWNKLKVQLCPMCRSDISPQDDDSESIYENNSDISYHNQMILNNQNGIIGYNMNNVDDEDDSEEDSEEDSEYSEENINENQYNVINGNNVDDRDDGDDSEVDNEEDNEDSEENSDYENEDVDLCIHNQYQNILYESSQNVNNQNN